MRNLKRALSLGLASAMVLGTMAFGASAKDFTDLDQVTNQKAVELVTTIGLMEGNDDGTFNPTGVVTRAEMAVICTTMLYGADFNVSQFVEANSFADMEGHWGVDYVNLAASLDIVVGTGDGNFDPNGQVTTAQAMVMLMRTLGYFQSQSEFGTNWELATTRKATELGLYNEAEDGELPAGQGLVRENVAALAFRALTETVEVDFNQAFGAYYNRGGSMANGVDNSKYEDTLGYNNFNKLFSYDSTDEFGRPCVTWMHNGTEIGTYETAATYEFTSQVTVKQMYDALGSALLKNEDYERGIWVDGQIVNTSYETEEFTDENKTDYLMFAYDSTTTEGLQNIIVSGDTTPFMESGAGVLTQVYIIPPQYTTTTSGGREKVEDGKIIISQIHTYLAEVAYSSGDDGDYEVGLSYYNKDDSKITQNAITTKENEDFDVEFDSAISYTKGTKLAVQLAYNSAKDEMEIVSVYDPTVAEGQATGSQLEPDVVGGSWLEVDGEQFDYAYSVRGNIDDKEAMVPVKQTEIKVYMDEYGYVLGYEAVVPAAQYLYVEETGSFNLGASKARVTLEDGTETTIEVAYIDNTAVTSTLWLTTMPGSTLYTTEDNETGSANENTKIGDVGDTNASVVNRIFGYEVLSDGTYKLLTEIRKEMDYESLTDEEFNSTRQEVGVLPGLYYDGSGDYSYNSNNVDSNTKETSGDGIHDIAVYAGGSHVHSPDEDTMFVYTSVVHGADGTPLESEVAKTYKTDGTIETISAPNSNFVFKIQQGNSYVLGKDVTVAKNDQFYDHIFAVDNDTIFVDVVGGTIWNGMDEVEDMEEDDLNMQVVFGKYGVADIVFINHGAPTHGTGDYFIVTDNEAVWRMVDGVDTYTYKVWINGVEDEIVVKSNELKDSKNQKLNNNDLYLITEQDDDGYVYEVQRYYQLDYYAHTNYSDVNLDDYGDIGTDKPMSAVYGVRNGVLLMTRNEWFDQKDDGPDFWSNTTDGDAYTAETYGNVDYADAFTYTEDTNFIVLSSNGDSSWDSKNKYSVRVGSVDDIRTIDETNTTWVDVIYAEKDSNDHPKAKTVLIINSKGSATSEGQLSSCGIDVHAVSGTGTTASSAYVLEGTLAWNGVFGSENDLSGFADIDFVKAIVTQYAIDSGYEPSSISFGYDDDGITNTGNDWQGKKVGEWNVKVSGTLADKTASTMYVNLTFGNDTLSSAPTSGLFYIIDKYTSKWSLPFNVAGATAYLTGYEDYDIKKDKNGTGNGSTAGAPIKLNGLVYPMGNLNLMDKNANSTTIQNATLVEEIVREYALANYGYVGSVSTVTEGTAWTTVAEGGGNATAAWIVKANCAYTENGDPVELFFSVSFTGTVGNANEDDSDYVYVDFDNDLDVTIPTETLLSNFFTADPETGEEIPNTNPFEDFDNGVLVGATTNTTVGEFLTSQKSGSGLDGTIFETFGDSVTEDDFVVVIGSDGNPKAYTVAGFEQLSLGDILGTTIITGLTKATAGGYDEGILTKAAGGSWDSLDLDGVMTTKYGSNTKPLFVDSSGNAYYAYEEDANYTVTLDFSKYNDGTGISCSANDLVLIADVGETISATSQTDFTVTTVATSGTTKNKVTIDPATANDFYKGTVTYTVSVAKQGSTDLGAYVSGVGTGNVNSSELTITNVIGTFSPATSGKAGEDYDPGAFNTVTLVLSNGTLIELEYTNAKLEWNIGELVAGDNTVVFSYDGMALPDYTIKNVVGTAEATILVDGEAGTPLESNVITAAELDKTLNGGNGESGDSAIIVNDKIYPVDATEITLSTNVDNIIFTGVEYVDLSEISVVSIAGESGGVIETDKAWWDSSSKLLATVTDSANDVVVTIANTGATGIMIEDADGLSDGEVIAKDTDEVSGSLVTTVTITEENVEDNAGESYELGYKLSLNSLVTAVNTGTGASVSEGDYALVGTVLHVTSSTARGKAVTVNVNAAGADVVAGATMANGSEAGTATYTVVADTAKFGSTNGIIFNEKNSFVLDGEAKLVSDYAGNIDAKIDTAGDTFVAYGNWSGGSLTMAGVSSANSSGTYTLDVAVAAGQEIYTNQVKVVVDATTNGDAFAAVAGTPTVYVVDTGSEGAEFTTYAGDWYYAKGKETSLKVELVLAGASGTGNLKVTPDGAAVVYAAVDTDNGNTLSVSSDGKYIIASGAVSDNDAVSFVLDTFDPVSGVITLVLGV